MSGRVIAVVLIICVLSLARSAQSSVLLSEDVMCKNGSVAPVNCSDPRMLKHNTEVCCEFSSAPVCCNEIPKLVAYIVAGVVGSLALFGGLLLFIAICCCCCFFGAGATFCARKPVGRHGMHGYQKV